MTFSCVLALAQGTYTQIDPPGSVSTECFGIDSAGDIVGSYADANDIAHGFILSDGVYTTVDYPGSQDTLLWGINDLGQIVGSASPVGFLYDWPTQTFIEQINFPGAMATQPTGINNAGVIVGYYYTTDRRGNEVNYGFALNGSTYSKIIPPGAGSGSEAFGITDFNAIVVWAGSSLGAFSLYRHNYQPIKIPNEPNAPLDGVNPAGTAVVGASGSTAFGFLYANNKLVTLDFPGSTYTEGWGVNNTGQVTGDFYNAAGNQCFLWTPPSPLTSK